MAFPVFNGGGAVLGSCFHFQSTDIYSCLCIPLYLYRFVCMYVCVQRFNLPPMLRTAECVTAYAHLFISLSDASECTECKLYSNDRLRKFYKMCSTIYDC